ASRLELDLLAADQHAARAPDDEVHLLLPLLRVVLFPPALIRREHEVVEAEGAGADGAARLPHHAARALALELAHVDDVVRGHRPETLLLALRLLAPREPLGEGAPQRLARDLQLVARPARLELHDLHLLASIAVGTPVGLGLA